MTLTNDRPLSSQLARWMVRPIALIASSHCGDCCMYKSRGARELYCGPLENFALRLHFVLQVFSDSTIPV